MPSALASSRKSPLEVAASEFAAWFSSDPSLPYQDIQVHGLPATGAVAAFMGGAKAYSAEAFAGLTLAPNQLLSHIHN